MTPLIIAIILCAAGCAVHWFAARQPAGWSTAAELGRAFILAGAFAVTLLLIGGPTS